MSAVNVNIQPEIIQWALDQTPQDKLGDKLINNIYNWLNGSKTPTFNQIKEFSNKSNIPLGYFFLQNPPKEQNDLLKYRTVKSTKLTKPSRDLIDTINKMKEVQEWMNLYRKDLGYDKLSFVGCVNDKNNVDVIAARIRSDLDLEYNWSEKRKDERDAFNCIREKLEECGVIVMMSGIVENNTHRPLDINEFRAFTMIDDWSPLIFINATDSNSGKLFSLLHEIVHIWLGENDLYNDRRNQANDIGSLEKMCNAVAAELLVPQQIFLEKWDNSQEEPFERITVLSRDFHCGELVIARKALDSQKISSTDYNYITKQAIEHFEQAKEKKKNAGGDYYNTQSSRLDRNFIKAICESVDMGRTSYTDAFHLTNTNAKTFSNVASRLGGPEW